MGLSLLACQLFSLNSVSSGAIGPLAEASETGLCAKTMIQTNSIQYWKTLWAGLGKQGSYHGWDVQARKLSLTRRAKEGRKRARVYRDQ
jgi:hypothetical protein